MPWDRWTFINQRWVFFGKIQRALRKVSYLREGVPMQAILGFAKLIGLQEYHKEIPASDFRLFLGLAADELLRDRGDGK